MQNTADRTDTRPRARDAADDAETRFRTELFGFDRVEVLSYIEKISAANAEKARALEQTITQLQQGISVTQQREDAIKQKARQVLEVLENQKKRAEDAVAEAAELRTQVDKANDEIAAVRSSLFAKEQENEALKNENAEFSATIDSLTRSLNEAQNSLAAGCADTELVRRAKEQADAVIRKADRQAAAEIERAKEHADSIIAHAAVEKNRVRTQVAQSADGIAASISVLKSQLTAVDAKILAATSDLQRATEGIVAALTNTERSLASLSLQSGDRTGISGSYYPAQQPAGAWNTPSYAGRADVGYDNRCSTEDEEYQRALYEVRREREAREASERREQERREQERREQERREQERREQERREQERREQERREQERREQERREQERLEQERLEQERREQERREQERLEQERLEQERREQERKRYFASLNQPMWNTSHASEQPNQKPQKESTYRPMRNRVDYTLKKAKITGQEQYDAVQNASRDVQMPYDLPTGFEPHQLVVTKPNYPQVAAQKPDDDPYAFGKPHAPRAMPFTAFDPYTPHTAPYMDPNAEEARILNAPPAPPVKEPQEKTPYVPQPTPITACAPLESVQMPKFGKEGAPMQEYAEKMQEIQNAYPVKDTPVIIPYSAPIPSSRAFKKESETAHPVQEGSDPMRRAPRSRMKAKPKETEEDLLQNLRAMLEE